VGIADGNETTVDFTNEFDIRDIITKTSLKLYHSYPRKQA